MRKHWTTSMKKPNLYENLMLIFKDKKATTVGNGRTHARARVHTHTIMSLVWCSLAEITQTVTTEWWFNLWCGRNEQKKFLTSNSLINYTKEHLRALPLGVCVCACGRRQSKWTSTIRRYNNVLIVSNHSIWSNSIVNGIMRNEWNEFR